MLLVIDNYDSFTYNLVQYLGELVPHYPEIPEIRVYRNDQITPAQIRALQPTGIVISPGPGRPETAGISLTLFTTLGPTVPILGVCLGHQSLGQAFGGTVINAPTLMHGKVSAIYHQGTGLFAGLPNPFPATRYHSLIVERQSLPETLEVTAWVDDLIMGLRHRDYPHLQGVQFHPESVLTECGKVILRNFLNSLS
ncbi:MAG: aminodeoxychorismate/anthranilate synthase component II [Cyanobacteria bacterium P01_G01_bin.54]